MGSVCYRICNLASSIELVPQVKACSVITLVICPKMATASFSNLPTRAFSPSYHNRHQSFVINNITRQITNPHLINFSVTYTSSISNKSKTCRPTVIFASGGGNGGGGRWGSGGGGGGGGDDDAGSHNCTEAIFALAKVSYFLVRNVYVFHRKFNEYVLILCLYFIRICCRREGRWGTYRRIWREQSRQGGYPQPLLRGILSWRSHLYFGGCLILVVSGNACSLMICSWLKLPWSVELGSSLRFLNFLTSASTFFN